MISSEKNPLPGRYIAFRHPSKEEMQKMLERWGKNKEQSTDGEKQETRIVEEEMSSAEETNEADSAQEVDGLELNVSSMSLS